MYVCIEPDWDNYEKMLDILYKEHPDAKDVAAHLGICHRSAEQSVQYNIYIYVFMYVCMYLNSLSKVFKCTYYVFSNRLSLITLKSDWLYSLYVQPFMPICIQASFSWLYG